MRVIRQEAAISKTLKTVGLVLGVAALTFATAGAFAPAGAGILGASFATLGTLATVGAGIANLGAQQLSHGANGKPPPVRGSVTQMLIEANAAQPYVMGAGFYAGILRHREGYGGTVDGVENPYLLDIVDYGGGGPYHSITPQIDFDAVPAWYSGYLATDTQLGACPETDALAASYGTPVNWGASHKLSGQAAIAWNFKFDKTGKRFASGFPTTGALIEGALAYDPRLDDTFPGGSGAHRLGDETTYEYTTNPALHAGTYAYGRYQGADGDIRTLGIGLPADGIDWAAVSAWASVCEANAWTMFGVAFEGNGGSEQRWANLKDICAAGGAEPIPGAVLSFRYQAAAVALDTITIADSTDEDDQVLAMQSYRDRVNTVLPKYRSPGHNWEMVQAEAITVPEYVTEDGEERTVEWPFNFVRDVDQAAQLAAYRLVDGRALLISLTCKPRLRGYRAGDCLHIDRPDMGLDLDAIVLRREIDPATMKVRFDFISETEGKHPFALGATGAAPATPALGQDAQERDETVADNGTAAPLVVADEAALVALDVPVTTIALRSDNGVSYVRNAGTSGTITDWTAIGNTTPVTSIVGISGTKAEYNTSLSDGDFVFAGDVAELAQDAVGTILTDTATIDFAYADATPSITADVKDGSITLAKQANVASGTVFYRKTASAGVPEVQTLATLKTDLGLTGTNSGDQFTAVTSSRILGRATAGFGAAEELTGSQATALLSLADASNKGLLSAADFTKLAGIAAGATAYTDEMARDALGAALVAGTGIDVTPNDGGDTIAIAIDTTEEAQRKADPSYPTVLRDEFLTGLQNTTGRLGELGWVYSNFTAMQALSAVAGHPGIIVATSSASIGQVNHMSWRKTTGGFEFFPNEVDELYWVFRQAATGNDADQRIGLHRDASGTSSDGLYLEKLAADTNWQFVGRASGSQNRQDTGIAANTTNWMKVRLRRETDTDWRCSINGGSEVAVTANIPTNSLGPFLQLVPTTANARALHVDFFSLRLKALSR